MKKAKMSLKPCKISQRLFDHVFKQAAKITLEEVRIGLGYTASVLTDGCIGLAATPRSELYPGCGVYHLAGKLSGKPADELLGYLVRGENPLEKALGLATANALLARNISDNPGDALEFMNIGSLDRVAMIGFFPPLVGKIEKAGASLSIIERDKQKVQGKIKDPGSRKHILRECTVAIITATTILNNTIEDILNDLGQPRHVAVIGPSTPLCPEVFRETPVTHLGGSVVLNRQKVMQVVSEGGGTPALRPYLRFVNLLLK
jgi:uncharacterized protein (DUF4213/DUF364 family)